MKGWKFFYKAIGIAENIIDPSYYHILALEAKDCDKQKVQQALAVKKRELRQSIPSPEFIVPILQFEKEVLEKAAEILSDDQQRALYNQQLRKRQREIETKNRKKQKLIEDVRQAVAEAVDENGMLGGTERYLLEEKLRLLEVQEHNIQQILKRIPEPLHHATVDMERLTTFFAGAVELSINNLILGIDEEKKLIQLAIRLGLKTNQARRIIDQQLDLLSAQHEAFKPAEIVLEKPIFFEDQTSLSTSQPSLLKDDQGPEETPEALSGIQQVPEKTHSSLFAKILQTGMPFLTISTFILVVIFLNAMQEKRTATPNQSDILPVTQPEGPKPAPKKTTPENQPQKLQTTAPKKESISPKTIVLQKKELESDFKNYPLDDTEDQSQNQILAEIAMFMLAIYDRASAYTSLEKNSSYDLSSPRKVLDSRVDDVLKLATQYNIEVKMDAVNKEIAQLRLESLKEMLFSGEEIDQHYAVERLTASKQRQAHEILIEALESKIISNRTMINKVFSTLAQSNSSIIARKLAELMPRAGRQTAFQIEMTLIEMTRITPEAEGVLPLKNKLEQRQEVSLWWQNQLWNWQPASYDTTQRKKYQFEKTLQLTAFISDLAFRCVDRLRATEEYEEDSIELRLKYKYGFDTPNVAQLKLSPSVGSDLLIDELDRLSREDDGAIIKADIVALNRNIERLSCRGDFHNMSTNLSAANNYLIILAQSADGEGQYKELISQLQQRHDQAVKMETTVLSRLRSECYFNVLFWDLLLQIKEDTQK